MKDLEEIVKKVEGVQDGVSNLIIPILKDTIKDNNRHSFRQSVCNVILAISLVVISIVSMIIISLQDKRYTEFLSQFEFESETVYQQTDDFSDINSGINITK